MRRRLFYQLLPLDGTAGMMSGSGRSIMPDEWDTQQPSNIDDDQTWPGMTERPKEKTGGATDLIFCLSRAHLGKFLAKSGQAGSHSNHEGLDELHEAERAIDHIEAEIEEKYIRYCDVVNPLHYLAICLARSGITAMRLFLRLPKFRNKTATDQEKRDMLQLAQRLLDTDTATRTNIGLQRYRWHTGRFFLWGTWDSLVYILTILTILWRSCDVLEAAETEAAWARVAQVFHNHEEILRPKRALYAALGHLTVKAWDTHPPSNDRPEPAFITTLRALQECRVKNRANIQHSSMDSGKFTTDITAISGSPSTSGGDTSRGNLTSYMDLCMDTEFSLDATDWTFWDQLMQDPGIQNDEQDSFLP